MTRIKFVSPFVLAAFLLSFATLLWGQANVDESQETTTLFVDATHGSDSNAGTQDQPVQTIGYATSLAVTNNQSSIGTKIVINPGTYRESINLLATQRDTSLPITFQAATSGTVVVSGADLWTGWKVYSGNASIYTNSWPNQWGLCDTDGGGAPPEQDIVRRREMIVINGTPLTQVLNLSAMRVGTFYVDETGATVYIWPGAGTDMSTAAIDVASRPNLFTIGNRSNVVLRGMVFQLANSCRGDAAVLIQNSSDNILIDRSFFRWNNAAGLRLNETTNTTVQNSTANYNGTSGMKGFQTKNDLWQTNQTRFNGWRGAQGVYYSWGESGAHFGLAHNQTLKSFDSSWNQTFGLHWDTDNANDTADSLVVSENLLTGGFIEKSEGPFTVSNSSFCNGNPNSGPNNQGFALRNSSFITLTGNTLTNNMTEFAIVGELGGIQISNWETGQSYNLFTQNLTLSNNVFNGGTSQKLFADGALDGSDWTTFQSTLISDYNTWWNGTATKVFTVPSPKKYTTADFSGWQSTSNNDKHSSWRSPDNPGAVCNITLRKADFWFVMDSFSGYQTVTHGSNASFTATVVPLAFKGTVTLSVDGIQNIPGATSSFSPATIKVSGTSTLTITTSASTPAGDYPITLIGTSGNTTHIMNVTLTVN